MYRQGIVAGSTVRAVGICSAWLIGIASAVLLPSFCCAQAAVSPTSCCNFQGCFVNSAAATAFERANKCRLCNPCTATVQKLQQVPLAKGDPTDGFVVNQTCIANRACAAKASLQSPAWLDEVVPAFVNPFLALSGQWRAVEAKCRARPTWLPFRDELCQSDMANYHISNDLQNALNTNGCGITADWQAVGKIISDCILAGLSGYWPGIKQIAAFIADKIVQSSRDSVRHLCIVYRTSHQLPVN